nr:RHS repeat-associated core domain-containing protein [Jiella flava]
MDVVWRAKYRPFGGLISVAGPASLDARFPGQWFQLESGLSYNWHRYYDATLGRYTQPDPLGWIAGPSLYAYADGNPVGAYDPSGLQEFFLFARPWWYFDWLRTPPPPPGQPKPPGWTPDWTWRYPEGTSKQNPRWFDPQHGEWRFHPQDKWHPEPHWDYNPWNDWNSPWKNRPLSPSPLSPPCLGVGNQEA